MSYLTSCIEGITPWRGIMSAIIKYAEDPKVGAERADKSLLDAR
jgi:hypothetical protein